MSLSQPTGDSKEQKKILNTERWQGAGQQEMEASTPQCLSLPLVPILKRAKFLGGQARGFEEG